MVQSKGKYMKKHTAMFLTFSALLTFNAFAPQVFWQESKVARFPAEVADSTLEHKNIDIDKSALLKLPSFKMTADKETRLEQIQDELDSARAELRSGKLEDSKIDETYAKIEALQDEAHALRGSTRKEAQDKVSIKEFSHENVKVNDINLLEEIVVNADERAAYKAKEIADINFDIKHQKIEIDKAILEKLPEVAKCEYKEEDLEAKIKSLIDDKKSIMEEIAELKEMKREKAAEKRAELAKKNAPKKREYQSDTLAIMSEFTNLMMSQQQQQMMMMQQMFSMMPQQQQRPMGIESLYSAHSYVPARMEMSYTQQYPLGYSRHEVGIDYVNPHGFQRFERAPSAQYEQRYMQQPAQMPQPMVEQAHEGFNFSQSGSANMNRVYFN